MIRAIETLRLMGTVGSLFFGRDQSSFGLVASAGLVGLTLTVHIMRYLRERRVALNPRFWLCYSSGMIASPCVWWVSGMVHAARIDRASPILPALALAVSGVVLISTVTSDLFIPYETV